MVNAVGDADNSPVCVESKSIGDAIGDRTGNGLNDDLVFTVKPIVTRLDDGIAHQPRRAAIFDHSAGVVIGELMCPGIVDD